MLVRDGYWVYSLSINGFKRSLVVFLAILVYFGKVEYFVYDSYSTLLGIDCIQELIWKYNNLSL